MTTRHCTLQNDFVGTKWSSVVIGILPLVPIVEQAGGVISDWTGNPLNLDSGPQVIAAASEELHAKALEILNA